MNASSQTQDLESLSRPIPLLPIAWMIWAIFTVGAAAVLVVGIPTRYAQLVEILDDLSPLGLSSAQLSLYALVFELLYALLYFGVAVFIFLKRRHDGRVIFFSIVLTAVGINQTYIAAVSQVKILCATAVALVVVFLYVFPDGEFTPRWTRVPAFVWLSRSLLWFLFPTMPVNVIHTHTTDAVPLSFFLILSSFVGLGLWSQVERYRRASYTERQQIKWLLFGLCFLAAGAAVQFSPWFNTPDTSPAGVLVRSPIAAALAMVWPLSILFAIMQFRLWSINWIIHRTAVYTLSVTLLVAIYILLISMLATLLRLVSLSHSQFLISLLATGIVTILFQPLRERIQRIMNRLVFGDRDDPYTVFTRLGRRLENSLTPDAVLPTILDTVKEAFRLPYVAIRLETGDQGLTAAGTSEPAAMSSGQVPPSGTGSLISVPLTYHSETVGYLVLSPRSPNEAFSPAEHALLRDLARQAGMSVHTMRLTAALQHVREEERLQLQRDLHDSVGPTLAAQVLKARSAVAHLARGDAAAVTRLLGELKDNLEAVTTEVRQIATNIRPPILDRLGFAQAMCDQASQFETASLRISVEIPEPLPSLPHVIEEAAYHIVREALTNVAKHAQACSCTVKVTTEKTELKLEITDDGCGLPATGHAGIGLGSMQDRAGRLGGRCEIGGAPDQGATVTAYLPLYAERQCFGGSRLYPEA